MGSSDEDGSAEAFLSLTLQSTALNGLPPLEIDFSYTLQVNGPLADSVEPTVEWFLGDTVVGTESAWRHTFTEVGSHDVRLSVQVIDAQGEVHEASAVSVVTVEPCVDLSINSVTLGAPTEVAPGDILSLSSATLVNAGAAIPQNVLIHAVISEDAALDSETDTVVAMWNFNGIPAGEFIPYEASLEGSEIVVPSSLEDGLYWLFLVVDPLEEVAECDETNNQAVASNIFEVDDRLLLKPDLTVHSFAYAQQGPLTPGDTLNYAFTITNQGEGDALSARVSTHLSTDGLFDPAEDQELTGTATMGSSIPVLAAQTSQSFLLTYHVPEDLPAGNYWLVVAIDLVDEVLETDEENNTLVASGPFTVVEKTINCADLELQAFEVTPPITYWQGTVRVEALIHNAGSIPVPSGWDVGLYVSLQPVFNPALATQLDTGHWDLPSIDSFGSHSIDELVTIPATLPVQSHFVWLVLDPEDDYPECSESNNSAMQDQTIQIESASSVELAVTNVGFHPASVEAGQEIKVGFKLHNTGSSQASSFRVAVVLSEDPSLSYISYQQGLELQIHDFMVPLVGPGETLEWVEKVIVPVTLSQFVTAPYTLGVVADSDNSQPSDANKNDNIDVAPLQLSVEGAQGGCIDDIDYEPNDIFTDALPIDEGLIPDLTACGDDDWFTLHLPAGHSLSVSLSMSPVLALGQPGHNLDLEVYEAASPAPELLASSAYLAGDEQVSVIATLQDRQLLIRVTPFAPTQQAHYLLDVSVLPPHVGVDLMPQSLELTPATLYPGGYLTASWSDVNLGSTAVSVYDAELWLSLDAELGDDDLLLATLPNLALDGATKVTREAAFVVPDSVLGGTYRILLLLDVPGFEDVVPSNNVTTSDPLLLDAALTCAEDLQEPNDARSFATPLAIHASTEVLTDLAVCPGLDDWFYVELLTGQSLEASVEYTHEADKGLVLLELYDADSQQPLLSDAGFGSSEVSIPWVWSPGAYYLRVTTLEHEGSQAPYDYTLRVVIDPGIPEMACLADAFEDNSASQTAATIGCGTQHATLCDGDLDIYRLELAAGQTLTVTLEHAESVLQASLYDLLLEEIVDVVASNGQLLHYSDAPTELLLEVKQSNVTEPLTTFDYTLTLDGLGGTDLSPKEVAVHPAQVVQGEDVQLSYTLANSCVDTTLPFYATIWLSQDQVLDETDVDVKSQAHPYVQGFDEMVSSMKVTIPLSTSPGAYWLIVEADSFDAVPESNELNNAVGIPLEVQSMCPVDALEPNNELTAAMPPAPAIAAPGMTGLSICPGDVDWLWVMVPAGVSLTATLTFQQQVGDLDLRLYDPTFSITQPIASSLTSTDNETVTYTSVVDTGVLLRVNGFDGASANYDVSLTYD